jgi:uncharacterized protein YndB with AHSA1/START domain
MQQPGFELSIERYINATPETVWKVWTERLPEWWCPKPWTTELIEQDLRPGGRTALIMRGPSGEKHEQEGIILEVVPQRRVMFTDAFKVGWVPQKAFMVGFFEMTPEKNGTRYRAGARHWDEASMRQHEQMGFIAGWSKVAEQLAELAEAQQRQ